VEGAWQAEVLIAQRYLSGGTATMPWGQRMPSEVLVVQLAVPKEDSLPRDFDIFQAILVKASAEGGTSAWCFSYAPPTRAATRSSLADYDDRAFDNAALFRATASRSTYVW